MQQIRFLFCISGKVNECRKFTLSSSTEGSTKKFKITVDDNDALSAVEVTE